MLHKRMTTETRSNSENIAFQLDTDSEVEIIAVDSNLIEPYVRIDVDHNLPHRLLRGPRYAHWNNAEMGMESARSYGRLNLMTSD